MKRLNDFMKWFFYITTGILIVVAINFVIAGEDAIPTETLWQILLAGFLTAGVTVFFHVGDSNRKSTALIRYALHYIALCIVMVACGHWFGWLEFDLAGIAMMMLSVAAVYFLSFVVYYMIDVKQAEEINQKLKEKYHDED